MTKLSRIFIAAAFGASILAATAAQAHGIWFAQRSNQLALIYGVGADDLDIIKRIPKVKSVTAYDEDGKEVPTRLAANGPLATVDLENQPAIVAAVLDNGLWSKTADGKWHNKGKDEVPDAKVSEHTWKYAVHLRRELTKVPALPGQTLQIVPLKAPLPVKMGQMVKVRVLFEGKPVAGAKILFDMVNDPDQKPLKTGKDGTVTIKLRNQGLNVLAAIYDAPAAEPGKTFKDEHLATLSFVLPHEPE